MGTLMNLQGLSSQVALMACEPHMIVLLLKIAITKWTKIQLEIPQAHHKSLRTKRINNKLLKFL